MPIGITTKERKDGRGRPKGSLDKVKRKPGTGLHDGFVQIVATDEDLIKIYELAALGKTRKIIASRLGIANSLLDLWMGRDKDARAAWEAGQAEHEESLTSVLNEVIADPKHKMRVPSVMFMLKCKHKWLERAAVEITQKVTAPSKFTTTEIAPTDETPSAVEVE
jgi:hypothetical protein